MTDPRTALPPASVVQLAIAAAARQREHGAVSALARQYGVHRQRVYDLGEAALTAVTAAVAPAPKSEGWLLNLEVHEADIARIVVALRVMTPASVRDIVGILRQVYGVGWGYGTVQRLLVEAGERASRWLAAMRLDKVRAAALDEMFSQGEAVMAGIDLISGYLFSLEVCPSRTTGEWTELLEGMRRQQGLELNVVVKDAGKAMAAAVGKVWPNAEQRDDLFHVVWEVGKEADHLERRAYRAIGGVEQLRERLNRSAPGPRMDALVIALGRARLEMDPVVERYDQFEALRRRALRLLELAERGTGRLRTSAEVMVGLTAIADEMGALQGERVRKLAGYLRNRAPGLALYLDTLQRRCEDVAPQVGGIAAVEAMVRAWQASLALHRGGPMWQMRLQKDELNAAVASLVALAERDPARLQQLAAAVLPILATRHRASSAVENLNSVLRPYLVVQKHAEQDFLDLFCFYWNTRTRAWGPHKGTSPYETMTGDKVHDWLTLLGYPPVVARAAA